VSVSTPSNNSPPVTVTFTNNPAVSTRGLIAVIPATRSRSAFTRFVNPNPNTNNSNTSNSNIPILPPIQRQYNLRPRNLTNTNNPFTSLVEPVQRHSRIDLYGHSISKETRKLNKRGTAVITNHPKDGPFGAFYRKDYTEKDKRKTKRKRDKILKAIEESDSDLSELVKDFHSDKKHRKKDSDSDDNNNNNNNSITV
jgi:hypothetical protein